jgi:hypothetical protein
MKVRVVPELIQEQAERMASKFGGDPNPEELAQYILDETVAMLTVLHVIGETNDMPDALTIADQIAQVAAIKLEGILT